MLPQRSVTILQLLDAALGISAAAAGTNQVLTTKITKTGSAGLGSFGCNRMRFIHDFPATTELPMTIGSNSVASPCSDSFATVF
jgi:hypothetical protein